MSANEDWLKTPSNQFGTFTDADDFLHPDIRQSGASLTETQYFGFNIPEENIYGFTYLWLHPNLDVVTGGVFACQGMKRNHMQAELFDVHAYLPKDEILSNDLHFYQLPNSYAAEVIEPGNSMRIRYDDPTRQNSFDFTTTAIMPVAMRGNNLHFEQAMKNNGELMLRGKRYIIGDTYNVRDRSWGQLRPEEINPIPPNTWMTGTFNDDCAFNCNAFDHPDLDPEWKGTYEWPADKSLSDGWIYRDGELIKIVAAKKLTRRDRASGRPIDHEILMTDINGDEHRITGTTTAGLPWAGWPNMICHLYLTRWEYDDMVGWGDTQECQWNDYVQRFVDPIKSERG